MRFVKHSVVFTCMFDFFWPVLSKFANQKPIGIIPTSTYVQVQCRFGNSSKFIYSCSFCNPFHQLHTIFSNISNYSFHLVGMCSSKNASSIVNSVFISLSICTKCPTCLCQPFLRLSIPLPPRFTFSSLLTVLLCTTLVIRI